MDMAWRFLGRVGVEVNVGAAIAAVASAVAIIITALRKRRDVDVADLQKRVVDLASRVEFLERTLDSTRDELIEAEHDRFILRRTLAAHGILDPTAEAS